METSVADNTDASISKEVEEENTEQNLEEFNAEDFSDLTPEEMSIQSEEQYKEGRQLLADSKFDEAVLILQRALSLRYKNFFPFLLMLQKSKKLLNMFVFEGSLFW